MARGTQHRKRRPTQNAGPLVAAAADKPRKEKPPAWQEELFFQRLRNHAKWAYVFLAVSFLLGFVLLGVGSGTSGLTDALQNAFNFGSSSGGASIGSLQKKVDQHPADATAWRDLATAYEQKHRTAEAITALQRYSALKPKDDSAFAELASQYTAQAQTYAADYQAAQAAATTISPATTFAPSSTTIFGKIYSDPKALQDPISQLLVTQASTKAQTAFANYTGAQKSAEGAYKKLAALTPTDVTVQYQLGQAATAAGDYAGAIAAYQRFLKLAPNDVDAPQVKQLLQAVKARAALSAAGTTSG